MDFESEAASIRPRLLNFIRRQVRCSGHEEDIMQDVFTTAYRNQSAFKGESKPSTWIFGIAINHLRQHRKEIQRHSQILVEDLDGELEYTEEGPEQLLQRQQNVERIERAMSHLNPRMRAVVDLVLGEGMTMDQAAESLQIPPGTVKSRLNRAREAIRYAQSNET